MRLQLFAWTILLALALGSLGEASVRIMPLGDSITAGYTNAATWSIPFTFGYRGPLYSMLTEADYDVEFVGSSGEPWNYPYGTAFGAPTAIEGVDLRNVGQDNHRGYGGATTSQLLNGGNAGGSANYSPAVVDMLNADNPDIVLLAIGTNGLTDGMNYIDPLVNAIVTTKPDAQLIVAQIAPRAASSTNASDPTVQYNSYIKNTIVPKYQALGKNVTTVDLHSNFVNTNGTINTSLLCPDGAHMRPAANELMAQTWFNGILALSGKTPDPYPVSTGTYTEGTTAPSLPANNLIVQGSDTLAGSYAGGDSPTSWSVQLPDGMNDGVMTAANALPILAWDGVTDNFGWAVYQLDTSVNTAGYDISEILSYAGWSGGRVNQAIEIKYALIGETVTEGEELGHTLGSFYYAASNNSTPYAYTTMSIENNDGSIMLSGVSAIQVTYLDNQFDGVNGDPMSTGNYTAYKQFTVIGTPSVANVPEPSLIILMATAILGLLLVRRKR